MKASNYYLVCITTNTCNASYPKIKWRQHILTTFSISQTSLLEIWYDEAAQAAIDMKTNIVRGGQCAEGHYVVLVAVWEIYGGTYELEDVI